MSVTAQDGMGLDKEAPSKEDSTHAEALARETIISRASHVRSLLTGSLDLLSSHQNSLRYVEGHDLLSRLNMWAGHTGVFAEFHISLDYRLRDIPDLKELILAHLRTMRLRLEQRKADSWSRVSDIFPAAEPDSSEEITRVDAEDQESKVNAIFSSLSTAIDWLNRLANTIRRASAERQKQRAFESRLKRDANDETTNGLTNFFSHVVKRDYPGIADDILDRMVSTMLLRRQCIDYRRSRQLKLALPAARPEPKPSLISLPLRSEIQTTAATAAPPATVIETSQGVLLPASHAGASTRHATTITSDAYRRAKQTPSHVSQATTASVAGNLKDAIPPAPKVSLRQKELVCPFCCFILPVSDATNRKKWSSHVKKDLDAYVCLFFPCGLEDHLFSTSMEWIAHMKDSHCTTWRCNVKAHRHMDFATEDLLLHHITAQHPSTFTEPQMKLVANRSRRAAKVVFTACPFCGETTHEKDTGLEDHVARHLQHIAFLSLPPLSGADGGMDGSAVSVGRSRDWPVSTRTTLKGPFSTSFPEIWDENEHVHVPLQSDNDDDGTRTALAIPNIPNLTEQEEHLLSEVYLTIQKRKSGLNSMIKEAVEANQRQDPVLANFVARAGGNSHTSPAHQPEPLYMKRAWVVPCDRHPHFIGREKDIGAIRQHLDGQYEEQVRPLLITGNPGSGKTQTLIEILYRMRDDYPDCSFIYIASNDDSYVRKAYKDAASQLGLDTDHLQPAESIRLQVQSHLHHLRQRCIEVIDYDDGGTVFDAPAEHNFQLVGITSKPYFFLARFGSAKTINIPEMSTADGLHLLFHHLKLSRASYSEAEATQLIRCLNFMPLEIVLAAACIDYCEMSLGSYIGLHQQMPEDQYIPWTLVSANTISISQFFVLEKERHPTISASILKVSEINPAAIGCLVSMALLHRADLLHDFFASGSFFSGYDEEATTILLQFSLITQSSLDGTMFMPSRVQKEVIAWLQQHGKVSTVVDSLLGRLSLLLPLNPDGPFSPKYDFWILLPHMDRVFELAKTMARNSLTVSFGRRYGSCLYKTGQYSRACDIFCHCLDKPVIFSPTTLTTGDQLMALIRRGNWGVFEEKLKTLLEGTTNAPNEERFETQEIIKSLAWTLLEMDQWDTSSFLFKKVLDTQKAQLGHKHPETQNTMLAFASAYRIEISGEDDPAFLSVMEGFKSIYNEGGNLLRDVLDIRKRTLGRDHHDTLDAKAALDHLLEK